MRGRKYNISQFLWHFILFYLLSAREGLLTPQHNYRCHKRHINESVDEQTPARVGASSAAEQAGLATNREGECLVVGLRGGQSLSVLRQDRARRLLLGEDTVETGGWCWPAWGEWHVLSQHHCAELLRTRLTTYEGSQWPCSARTVQGGCCWGRALWRPEAEADRTEESDTVQN